MNLNDNLNAKIAELNWDAPSKPSREFDHWAWDDDLLPQAVDDTHLKRLTPPITRTESHEAPNIYLGYDRASESSGNYDPWED